MIGPRLELVEGRRAVQDQFGLRNARDSHSHRAGHIEPYDSPEFAVHCRDKPFNGFQGDEEVITRTVVTYTTQWTVVPGYEGSRWFHCWHEGRPDVHEAAGGHAAPHAFRERDMAAGEDGIRRYTCPVCGKTWQHREPAPPQGALF